MTEVFKPDGSFASPAGFRVVTNGLFGCLSAKGCRPCSSHNDATPKQSERDAVGEALFLCRPLLKMVTDLTLTHALLLCFWIRCFTMIIPA